jgi:hypothetical protein
MVMAPRPKKPVAKKPPAKKPAAKKAMPGKGAKPLPPWLKKK